VTQAHAFSPGGIRALRAGGIDGAYSGVPIFTTPHATAMTNHDSGDASPPAGALTREYPADGLVVEWRQGLCQHSGSCVRALPRVFNLRRQPWVETGEGTADDIRAAVARCPSGALRVRDASKAPGD
jgi:uncharacterized Fe-S cluster protein YjdI